MNTVEGALVFTALTLTAGMLAGGFVTLAQHSAVTSVARDAARAQALGHDGTAVVASRMPQAQVLVEPTAIAGVASVKVTVTKRAALFDVTGTAVTVAEEALQEQR